MAQIGDQVGSIRLTEHLGEGGMGEVYAGFDEKLHREVAVKTVRGDRISYEARARLLSEARALSRLDHPNVCRLLEYVEGEDSDHLVLELIRGRTLRRVLGQGPTPDQGLRWRIAEQVAQALVVAHAQGIVHRDLKLDNVMLTSEGEVKVLDFGLARWVESPSNEPSSPAGPSEGRVAPHESRFYQTEAGQVMGTLTSMSPEQAQGRPSTPASDMYSFGLLVQELFTGHQPYPTSLSAQLLSVHVADGKTLPMERGDADLVALVEQLKSPDPQDRPSAEETLRRLRWIQSKPGRRRRLLVAALAALVLLAAGAKYTFDLRYERNEAVTARSVAEQAREDAEQARGEAEKVTLFLAELFVSADPWRGTGEELTVRQLLELGRQRVDQALPDQPRVRTQLRQALGLVYMQVGQHEVAQELLSKAIEDGEQGYGTDHPQIADALVLMAILHRRKGDYEQAEELYHRALEIYERIRGKDSGEVATILNNLAVVHAERGNFQQAEELYRRSLEIRERILEPDDPDLAMTLHNLATVHLDLGLLSQAEEGLQRALTIQKKSLGPDSLAVSRTYKALASVSRESGRFEESKDWAQRALEIDERTLGPDHYEVAVALKDIAQAHQGMGEPDRAEALYLRALDIYRDSLGPRHQQIAHTRYRLAALHLETGRYEEAWDTVRQALDGLRGNLDEDNYHVALARGRLGAVHYAQGKLDEARNDFEHSLAFLQRFLGDQHPYSIDMQMHLAATVLRRGDAARAHGLYQQAMDALRQRLVKTPANRIDHRQLAVAHLGLGRVAAERGQQEEAVTHWGQALDALESLGDLSADVRARHVQALVLLHLDRIEDARPMVDDLLSRKWRHPDLLALARARL